MRARVASAVLLLIAGISAVDVMPASAGTVRGWCTVLPPLGGGNSACVGSALEACQIQKQAYAADQTFLGVNDDPGRWDVKHCDWSTSLGVIHPSIIGFYCASGELKFPGVCPDPGESPPGGDCSATGATSQNTTGHPIEILTGAKLYSAEDFRTADGSLFLSRRYRSTPYRTADLIRRMPLGLSGNWQFDFVHELHIHKWFYLQSYVEVQAANGNSYQFIRQSDGSLTAVSAMPQTTYSLEFVGAWPSDLATVLSTQTQWRLRDDQDRVWLFQSYNDADLGYVVAHPIQVTFRGGLQWTFQYGSHNELTSITDSFGKTITFDWILFDPNAQFGVTGRPVRPKAISQAHLPDGTSIRYVYEAQSSAVTALPQPDRLIRVEHVDAANTVIDSTTYHYENSAWPTHITGITDASGTRIWTVTYDSEGRAIRSTRPDGTDNTTVAYDPAAAAMTRTVTNALGKSTVYRYTRPSATDYKIKLVGVDGAASSNCPASARGLGYDSANFISSTTDEEGRVTSYVRDARGRPTQITEGAGTADARVSTLTWHTTFTVPTRIVQPGLTTDLTWNSLGQLTQVTRTDTTTHTVPYATSGQTRTWTYTYDSYGRPLTVDGPLPGSGDTTTYTYGTGGYLASVTNELGQVTLITARNGRGLLTTVVDENGVTRTLTYDALGRLKTVTIDPSGLAAMTSIDYNTVGDIVRITRPNGVIITYSWDTARRLTGISDPSGAAVTYVRDALGNATSLSIRDSLGTLQLAQSATYDELGRLLASVGANGQAWTNTYDKTDNLVSSANPVGGTYQYAFDSLSRLIGETNEEGAAVALARNAQDEVTAYTDPRSLTTSYVRNGFGEAIQRISPDSGTTTYEYNALGKATKITDARGVVTDLAYDNAGRLTAKTYPAAPTEAIAYSYDATSGGNKGIGRQTGLSDASGSLARVYDALGRITQETKTTAGQAYPVSYVYDGDGNVTRMTYPSGRIVDFARDAAGRVSGVTTRASAASPVQTLASDVTYAPMGPLTALTYGNGLILTKTYTQDYLIDTLRVTDPASGTDILSRQHGRSDQVNLTDIWDAVDAGRTETYMYGLAGRLEHATGPYGDFGWAYDPVGNRIYESIVSGATSTDNVTSYGTTSNRIVDVTSNGTLTRAFTHDAAGNMTGDDRAGTAYTYVYNNRGRLSGLTIGTTPTASYVYDALERLAIRTTQNMTPAGTTHYVYDLAGHLIAEASASGGPLRDYVWLDDMPLALVADLDTATPHLTLVHADHLDRPIKMTDASKAVVWDAVYKPFGEVQAITGAASNNLRFPGQYFLIEAGLHYNWHRHYDPTTGRYIQPDPLEFIDGPNRYTYVNGTPITARDTTGHEIVIFSRPWWLPTWRWFNPFRIPDPPISQPKPPGWTPDWEWRCPEGVGKGNSNPRWFDPGGGEWRWHAPDRYHPEGHWDHNPWTEWNSQWRNIKPEIPEGILPSDSCPIGHICS